jgi:PEP-CTERM motif
MRYDFTHSLTVFRLDTPRFPLVLSSFNFGELASPEGKVLMNSKCARCAWYGVTLAVAGLIATAGDASPIALSSSWSVNDYNLPAPNGVHVTLSGESATGYTFTGSGTSGLPGTTMPDSRRRPKVYQDFAAFDAGAVGSTISMTYDIQWGGNANPSNQNAAWRFGFISSTANGGKGLSLGADLDLGNLAGTVYYEFLVDPSATSGEAGSGIMDSGFTDTLNSASDSIARIGQGTAVPPGNNVAFNDRVKTHRVTLTLERILDGYNLSLSWQNLAVGGTTITNSATILTSDFDPSVALAAGITSWDRLGFFVNADVVTGTDPWVYTLSNVSIDAAAVPEPNTIALALFGLAIVGRRPPKHVRSR